jgi:hypothetical protein
MNIAHMYLVAKHGESVIITIPINANPTTNTRMVMVAVEPFWALPPDPNVFPAIFPVMNNLPNQPINQSINCHSPIISLLLLYSQAHTLVAYRMRLYPARYLKKQLSDHFLAGMILIGWPVT